MKIMETDLRLKSKVKIEKFKEKQKVSINK